MARRASFASRIQPAANGTWRPPQTIASPRAGILGELGRGRLDAGGNATAAWMETNFTPAMTHPVQRRLLTQRRGPRASAGAWSGQTPITDVLPSLEQHGHAQPRRPRERWRSLGARETPPGQCAGAVPTRRRRVRPADCVGSADRRPRALRSRSHPTAMPRSRSSARGTRPASTTLDASPPVIASVTVPATATTGQAVAMSASA